MSTFVFYLRLFSIFLLFILIDSVHLVQSANEQIVHLKPSISLSIDTDESVRIIHMVCPIGTRWTVPETVNSSTNIALEPQETQGSVLTLYISLNETKQRVAFRGLYECCPINSEAMVTLNWMPRSVQPICCPCCPWYEQHRCLSSTSDLTEAMDMVEQRNQNVECASIFLFTGTVDTQAVRLHIVPDEPMLLPCPAPYHTRTTHDNPFPLTIRHRFFQHTALDTPWFPFTNPNHGVDYQYDPRYGLCLYRAQFPRSTLQLACQYQSTGQIRLIQAIWPPSSPTIAPDIELRITNGTPPLTDSDVYGFEKINGENQVAVYRALQGSSVRVRCLGVYTQLRIVRHPPPKLCFLWVWSESNKVNISAEGVNGWNRSHRWQLNACPPIQTVNRPKWAVYASNEIELPLIRRPVTVGCQIRTPTRRAPSISRRVHIIPVISNRNRLFWYVASHNQASMTMLSTNLDVETNRTAILLITYPTGTDENMTIKFSIHFWAEQETSGWPICLFNGTVDTGTISPVRRIRDRWQCDVTWTQSIQVSNLSLVIRYTNLTQSILIFTTSPLNGTTPLLTGLHGNVRRLMQLTCNRNDQEKALINLLTTRLIYTPFSLRYTWDIELRDGPQGQTHAFNLSQPQPTLVLQPLQETNSFLNWSHTIDSTESITEFPHISQPISIRGPRMICVQCHSVYATKLMWSGSKECQSLADWSIIDWNWPSKIPSPKQLLLFLRQNEMPIQTWPDTTKNWGTFYFLNSVPFELECVLSEGLSQNQTRKITPQLWPSIHWWAASQRATNPIQRQTWQLSPYSRTMNLKLNRSEMNGTGEDYFECKYGKQSVRIKVKPIHPIGPFVLEARVKEAHVIDNFSAASLNLYCQAEGLPLPSIYWESDMFRENETKWSIFHVCHAPHQWTISVKLNECNRTIRSSDLKSAKQIRCRAVNYQSIAIKTVPLPEFNLSPASIGAVENLRGIRSISPETLWIIILCPLILLISAILAIVFLRLYRQVRKIVGGYGLRPIANALYTKPVQSVCYRRQGDHGCIDLDTETDTVRELVYLLGSVDQLTRWHIPRNRVELTDVRLGLGHYGRVIKGWYIESTRVPVAIKTASAEPNGSQCLRNEIQILPILSDGTNIARMIGLIVGQKQDLSDTYLVLEYCEHRSLAEFVRKHAHQLMGTESRAQQSSLYSNDSGVYSMNGTDRNNTRDTGSVKCHTLTKPYTHELTTYRLTHQALHEFALGIANGVDFIAQHGIIHRDLATRNVLIDANFTPRICDFGLAVRVARTNEDTIRDDAYRITSFQKQLPFRILPPEALTEQTFYLASDIWELGLLFWQLFHLETRKPFVHISTTEELVRQLQMHFHTNAHPTSPPTGLTRPKHVSDILWAMMCRAWQGDPKQRPAASEFCTILRTIIDTMRSKPPCSGPEQVNNSSQELNYITCVDLSSTDLGSEQNARPLQAA